MSFPLQPSRVRAHLRVLGDRDRRIARAVQQWGLPPERRNPADFSTLVRALTGQQVSTRAAQTIFERIERHFKGSLDPQRVARVRLTTLRKLGLSGRKAEYLRGLAGTVARGELVLADFPALSDEEITARISSVRGFGVWSAQMYLIFSLGRPDVWPVDDLGVRKGIQRIFQLAETPSSRGLVELGEVYTPYRSALSLLAWHVTKQP